MARVDLHTHSHFSRDSVLNPAAFVRRAEAAGLTHLAVTDHGGVEGAYAVRELASCEVINGQEVKTTAGEVLALFIEEAVADGLSPGLATARIRGQGGIVVAAHPFDVFRSSLGTSGLMELGGALDAIEGYNGRSLLRGREARARLFAKEHGLPVTLGSDAHAPRELGRSWADCPDFGGSAELLHALDEARYTTSRPAPWLLPSSGLARARWLAGWRPPSLPSGGGSARQPS
jgi:hypothetical protein